MYQFDMGYFSEMWKVGAAFSLLCTIIAYIAIREKDRPEFYGVGNAKAQKVSLKDYVDVLKHNKALQMLVISASTDKLGRQMNGNATVSIILYAIICGNASAAGLVGTYTLIPGFLMLFFGIGFVARKFGQLKGFVYSSYGAIVSFSEGTLIATGAACGASTTEETVRDMAKVGAEEAKAIGCNWVFAPVCDVVSNWRNTIVNTRAFGHVYKTLIDAGLPSIMVGHICQPAYSKKFYPGMKDSDIKPATLSPELLQNLLREQLGFNGLIVTDASHMAGLTSAAARKDYIPGVIAAGCDMILFFNDPAEDIQYIKDGLASGVITRERFEDAIYRILGLKTMLGLNDLKFPSKDGLKVVGCQKHHELAEKAADESITLVKDTQGLLPINVSEKKNLRLYFLESAPVSLVDGPDKAKARLVKELEEAGFNVTAPKDIYEYEMEQPGPMNKFRVMSHENREEFKANTDVVLFVINMKGYAQENNVRLKYDASHSGQIPWFVNEVPTVAVSLNYTNHLYDVPMMKTFVNAYSDSQVYLHALVEKLTGKSQFKGTANELVWCDRWDTRL